MNKFCKKFFSQQQKKVTFVGLGNMGYKMANNLLLKKYLVSGFDLNDKVVDEFHKKEGSLKRSFSESVKDSDFIMTMLDKTQTVEKIWNNVFDLKPNKGTIIIDSSTINPINSKNLSIIANEKGLISADAPVSGGVTGAQNGTLTFMTGTKDENFPLIKDFLSAMGLNIINCGEYGSGQIVKLCNNLALGTINLAINESLCLGQKMGMDMKKLVEVLSLSTSYNWVLNVNTPVPGIKAGTPSSRDYEGGFKSELMIKDMNLALELAQIVNKDLKVSKQAAERYEVAIKEHNAKDKDFSYIYDCLVKDKF